MVFRGVLLALALTAAASCNGKKARPTPSPDTDDAATAARCDALEDKVAGLYRAALEEPVDGEIADNTHMVLTDCRKDPARFAPCIERAASVAQLERDCVIPLDEEGTVEAEQFKDLK